MASFASMEATWTNNFHCCFLLALFSLLFLTDLSWHLVTFFIWHLLLHICTDLLRYLGTGGVRGDHLHLVTGGQAHRPSTLRQTVRLGTALAHLKVNNN